MRKKILDMGSGLDPNPRATHAYDYFTKTELEKSNQRKARFRGVKFTGGVDFNKRMPRSACDTFHEVISDYSLGPEGNQEAYRNAHCLLKCGGKIQIRGGDTREIPSVRRRLERAGFSNIQERILPPPKGTTSPDYEVRATKACNRGTPRSRR